MRRIMSEGKLRSGERVEAIKTKAYETFSANEEPYTCSLRSLPCCDGVRASSLDKMFGTVTLNPLKLIVNIEIRNVSRPVA